MIGYFQIIIQAFMPYLIIGNNMLVLFVLHVLKNTIELLLTDRFQNH
jgi:hypothetical protein